MAEQLPQHPDEESQQEKSPELKFEHDWPIDELAQFVSDVRAKEGEHWEKAGKVHRRTFSPKEVAERIERYQKNPDSTEVVLTRDGELIGCVFSFEQSEEELAKEIPGVDLFSTDKDKVFSIRELDIKDQCRGQGYGRMIMKQIMQEARQKGATKLVLSTFPFEELPAFQLYKKLGFKSITPEKGDIDSFYMAYDFNDKKSDKN